MNIIYKKKVLILIIIIIITLLCSYYMNKEGFNNYYDNKPKMNMVYLDEDNIEISTLGAYGKCLIIDGEIQLCEKKEHIYHEMIVHFPAQYLKKNIENVVIIGGGDLMTLREVMKYKTIKNVYMLELSPIIVNICKKYFKQSDFKDDKRVEIIYGDASKTIKDLIGIEKENIDMIIVDTTEDNENNLPVDKPAFFIDCFKLLNDNGILIKNGVFFKRMLEDYDDLNTIPYNVDIPYFQEKYFFVVASKSNNDIKKKNINESRWKFYNIKTKFYKQKNHNNYIIFEDYDDDYESENKLHKKIYGEDINIYNDNDMYKKLL